MEICVFSSTKFEKKYAENKIITRTERSLTYFFEKSFGKCQKSLIVSDSAVIGNFPLPVHLFPSPFAKLLHKPPFFVPIRSILSIRSIFRCCPLSEPPEQSAHVDLLRLKRSPVTARRQRVWPLQVSNLSYFVKKWTKRMAETAGNVIFQMEYAVFFVFHLSKLKNSCFLLKNTFFLVAKLF